MSAHTVLGVHIGARALLDINLMWFGYIARLSQLGGGGNFTPSSDFYLPALLRLEGGGGQHLCSTLMRESTTCVKFL